MFALGSVNLFDCFIFANGFKQIADSATPSRAEVSPVSSHSSPEITNDMLLGSLCKIELI